MDFRSVCILVGTFALLHNAVTTNVRQKLPDSDSAELRIAFPVAHEYEYEYAPRAVAPRALGGAGHVDIVEVRRTHEPDPSLATRGRWRATDELIRHGRRTKRPPKNGKPKRNTPRSQVDKKTTPKPQRSKPTAKKKDDATSVENSRSGSFLSEIVKFRRDFMDEFWNIMRSVESVLPRSLQHFRVRPHTASPKGHVRRAEDITVVPKTVKKDADTVSVTGRALDETSVVVQSDGNEDKLALKSYPSTTPLLAVRLLNISAADQTEKELYSKNSPTTLTNVHPPEVHNSLKVVHRSANTTTPIQNKTNHEIMHEAHSSKHSFTIKHRLLDSDTTIPLTPARNTNAEEIIKVTHIVDSLANSRNNSGVGNREVSHRHVHTDTEIPLNGTLSHRHRHRHRIHEHKLHGTELKNPENVTLGRRIIEPIPINDSITNVHMHENFTFPSTHIVSTSEKIFTDTVVELNNSTTIYRRLDHVESNDTSEIEEDEVANLTTKIQNSQKLHEDISAEGKNGKISIISILPRAIEEEANNTQHEVIVVATDGPLNVSQRRLAIQDDDVHEHDLIYHKHDMIHHQHEKPNVTETTPIMTNVTNVEVKAVESNERIPVNRFPTMLQDNETYTDEASLQLRKLDHCPVCPTPPNPCRPCSVP